MHIIAVDDEKLLMEHLTDCIKEAAPDAEVLGFQRPSEAFSYAQEHAIDVVFLDIQMRGMNGLELGKKLKALQPQINIVFCTGFSDYIFEAVTKVRCSGYLLKPVSTEDVRGELEVALWDDEKDHKAYLKKCRKDLADTLEACGCGDVLQKSWGGIALNKDRVDCDYYNWLEDKAEGIKAFNGEYMEQYSWAEFTKGSLLD